MRELVAQQEQLLLTSKYIKNSSLTEHRQGMPSEATTFASSILSAHSVPLTAEVRDAFSAETFNFFDAHERPCIVVAITHVRFRATFNRHKHTTFLSLSSTTNLPHHTLMTRPKTSAAAVAGCSRLACWLALVPWPYHKNKILFFAIVLQYFALFPTPRKYSAADTLGGRLWKA